MDPQTTQTAVATRDPNTSVWQRIADRHGLDFAAARTTILNTLMPRRDGKLIASEADMAAALLIADRYNLDPFAKEIYFTPARGGGILSIVGLDGWITHANRQANYKGWEYADIEDASGKLLAVDVTIHFRDGRDPMRIREWYEECKRPTDPWKTMPRRMLRNRALCQAIRCAFGMGGVMLEDEAADLIEPVASRTVASKPLTTPPTLTQRIADRGAELAGERTVTMTAEPVLAAQSKPEPSGFTSEDNAALDRGIVEEQGESA